MLSRKLNHLSKRLCEIPPFVTYSRGSLRIAILVCFQMRNILHCTQQYKMWSTKPPWSQAQRKGELSAEGQDRRQLAQFSACWNLFKVWGCCKLPVRGRCLCVRTLQFCSAKLYGSEGGILVVTQPSLGTSEQMAVECKMSLSL